MFYSEYLLYFRNSELMYVCDKKVLILYSDHKQNKRQESSSSSRLAVSRKYTDGQFVSMAIPLFPLQIWKGKVQFTMMYYL